MEYVKGHESIGSELADGLLGSFAFRMQHALLSPTYFLLTSLSRCLGQRAGKSCALDKRKEVAPIDIVTAHQRSRRVDPQACLLVSFRFFVPASRTQRTFDLYFRPLFTSLCEEVAYNFCFVVTILIPSTQRFADPLTFVLVLFKRRVFTLVLSRPAAYLKRYINKWPRA